jgi:hypothetical protein
MIPPDGKVSQPGVGSLSHLKAWKSMASRKPKNDRRKRDRLPRRLFKRPRDSAIPPGDRDSAIAAGSRGPAVPPGTRVVYSPAGREKMSEVLEDFIEPYKDSAPTEDKMRNLLTLGILAWNAALMPEPKRQAFIDEMIEAGFTRANAADRALARDLVEIMVRRKLEHFAANRRAIVSFELTDRGYDFHLSVASTL